MSKSGNLAALAAIFNPADRPHIYYAEDPPYLSRILIFYWPVHAVGSVASTSRIRITILTAAGFKSFGAFSVSPSSAYYSAVHKLPEDKQRDEVSRGIAFGLCRYFSEVPTEIKNAITEENLQHGIGLKWGQSHAAQITCSMSRVVNAEEVIDSLRPFQKDRPSTPPAPILRPLTSIRKTRPSFLPQEVNASSSRFGQFSTPSRRTPSGQARRTPSSSTPAPKSSSQGQTQQQSREQLESLRFKMCEFVDTEDRYITRLQQLIELVTTQSRTPKSISSKFPTTTGQNAVNAMLQFPSLLSQIRELNLAFLEDLETSLQNTENSAMVWLQETSPATHSGTKDVVGAYAFSKVLLNHFPALTVPYREYLDLHSQISSNLDQFLKEGTLSIQQVPSLLMEPAQRISRYSLYIDAMIPHLPSNSAVMIRSFEKARKIIAEICEMEPAASTILDSLRIEHESRRRGALSPTKLLSTLTRSNGTIREAPSITSRDNTPRLLPSLSRSFSRKHRSRPALAEQNIDQATNLMQHSVQPQPQLQPQTQTENTRPKSSGSMSILSMGKARPTTAGSSASGGGNSARSVMLSENAEQYQALEEENYRLLQENAELKRLLRGCRCQI